MKKLLWFFLCVGCFAQDQSNSNVIVVGNPAQPVQPTHWKAIQDAINRAGSLGFVVIPADYPAGETISNPNNTLILDLRASSFGFRGGGSGTGNGGGGGTSLCVPGSQGIVVSNGVDCLTTVAGTADINGALGFNAANDANVVHPTGTENIGGLKTFTSDTTFNGNINLNGTLNFNAVGPFFWQFVKQTGTPTVVSPFDSGAYLDSASILRCLLRAGGSCGLGISPIYLNSGTPSSQTNECSLITNDSIGDTSVVAVAALRTVIAGVGHDVLCMVTTDATNPGRIGTLVFPGAGVAYSANSAPSQGAGAVEALGSTGGVFACTNNGGTTRKCSINFRSCNGPGATGCGTDLQFVQDSTNAKLEEWEFLPGGTTSQFYMGGLGSTHPGIYFGNGTSGAARSSAPFGFDGPSTGNLSHLLRLAADGDIWNPATLVSGTVTVNFQRNHTGTAKPLCFATWQGTGTLTGILKCVVNGSAGAWTGITITSTSSSTIIASGLASMPTGLLTTNTCASAVTVTATGAVGGDIIQWSYNNAPSSPDGLLTISPYATTNNVNFLQCNPTSASQTPAASTLAWIVVRPSGASDNATVSYLVVGDAF